jgi:hypothetical protein
VSKRPPLLTRDGCAAWAHLWPRRSRASCFCLCRTYTKELQALSEAASHELRLVLETLGVGGLVSLLSKLQVPVDPGRGGDLAYLLSCVVTACPGPGSLVPHLPKGAARVFEAGLEAFETDHCLTKRRLVQRCARLRHKFQAASAAVGRAGGGGVGGAPSLALPPPAPQQQQQQGGDAGGDSYDEEDEDEEEYSDEDEDGEYDDEDEDEVDLSDEEEEDFDEELSGEDDLVAGGRRGGTVASRRRGIAGSTRGRGGVGAGTAKGGRYSCTLCGMASLKRGCASCGLAICRVCWQMEGSLPPGWLDTCTNAECRFTSCLACRRERPCVRCGTHPSTAEVGMLRRRRKTLVLAMNKLCGAAAATLAGNAPVAAGGGAGGRGVSPARGAAAAGSSAAGKKAASVLEAEAAAQAAADQLLREEEAERQAAEDKARKAKEKRDKKKQKGEAAAQAEAATASPPKPPPAASTPEKAPPVAPPPGASSPATPPPGAKVKGPAQTPSKKKGAASPAATAKAVSAPAAPSSPPVSQAMVDKLVADAAGACDALCSATDGGSAASLDKAIAGAESLLGKWSSSGESSHPDAAAGLQMLMDVILAARAARRSIKPGQAPAANGKVVSPASSPGAPAQQAPKAGGVSNGQAGSKAPPAGPAAKPVTPVKAAMLPPPGAAFKPAPPPAPVSRPAARAMLAPMSQAPPPLPLPQQQYQQPPQMSPGMHPPPPGRMMPSPGVAQHPQVQPQVSPQMARNPPPRGGPAMPLPSPPSAWGPPPTPAAATPLSGYGGQQGTPGANGGGVVGDPSGGGAFGGHMWRSGGSPFGSAGATGLWTPVMPHAPGGAALPTATPPSLGLGNGAFSLGGGSTWGGLMAPSPLPNGGGNTPHLWGATSPLVGGAAPPPSLPRSGTSSGNSSSEGLGPSPSGLRPSARLWAGVGTSPAHWGGVEEDRAVGSPRGQPGGQMPLMVESMLETLLLEGDVRSPVTSPVKAKANGGGVTTSWGAGQHTPPWGGHLG